MTTRLLSENYVDGDQSILKQMQESFDINAQANQSYWLEGTRDVRFKAGDQNLWNELYTNYPAFQKKKFNFNRIRRIVNMICGFQRRNRKTTIALPVEGSDEFTADQFSRILNWVNTSSNFYHTISEAFEGAVTTGMNLLSVWMDYREDPINGNIRLDNLSYNGFMMDQFFRKHDLSDANFIWIRKYLSKPQAISLMPERRKEIMEMQGNRRDDKFTFEPENFNIDNPNLLSYDEYWHLDYRPATILIDGQSGETMEWKGSKENLEGFLSKFPQISPQKIQKQTVKLAVVVQNRVMYYGANPYAIDKYPFIPVLGYFEPDVPYFEWKIQGVVRSLRDSQFLYNRRKVIELDILESQINSGMKVMEGSLVDDNDAFMSGQGRALFLKQDAPLGMDSVQSIQPPQVPPSMMEMSAAMANEINEISGVNEELLGSADDDKAGILSMLRQGAGLTTLQTLFDNLDRSQKLLGELSMSLVQQNFSAGKVQRILGEEPSEQFFDKAFQKYDAVVTEGALTETQRKGAFMALMEMQKIGISIPPDILIEKAPIPEKKDLVDAIKAQQKQQAELQQRQAELQMAQIKAQINLAESRALADQGLGVERISRIEENKALAVERRAEAIKDMEMASLDKARAAKELQGIDIKQLEQLVGILNTLQMQDMQKAKLLSDSAQPQQAMR